MKTIFNLPLMAALLLLGTTVPKNGHAQTVEKAWETDSMIRTPESVLWDAEDQLFYVSDINGNGSAKDGNGFISTIGVDGKIIDLHWADGLDAPKGMGSYGGRLYVADLSQLVIINIASHKIEKKITLPGASFLNDVAVDQTGNVFVSDSRYGIVYRYFDGKASVYLNDPEIKGANGLLVERGTLWIDGAHGIFQYNPQSKSLKLFTDAVKSCDGITSVGNGDLVVSRWQGEVYYVSADGSAIKILDVKSEHKNTADLFYVKEKHLLVIPTFNGNVVMGYTVHEP